MKHFLLILFSFLSFSPCFSQYYRIQFTDKKNNEYSTSQPQTFLSQRAIERRKKQNIPIAENDLPVNKTYIQGLKDLGVKIKNTSKWLNSVTIYNTTDQINTQIKALSFVKSIECTKPFSSTSSKNLNLETCLENDSAAKATAKKQLSIMNGDILHRQGFTGKGIQIAVIDGGFQNLQYYDYFKNLDLLGKYDFVNNDTTVFHSSTHGTNVLSLLAGKASDYFIGTAPDASYYLLISEDAATEYIIEEDNWASAAEFADSVGVDIISSSLGYSEFDLKTQNHTISQMNGNTTRVTIAADIAASKGILVVSSAGNQGNKSWKYLTAPADADSILTVGSVNAKGTYSAFSSQGLPDQNRIKPDVMALGEQTATLNPQGSLEQGSGTSYSAPLIAGMMACLWQAQPNLTNMQLIDLVKESSSQYQNPDVLLGYGIPNFWFAANQSKLLKTNTLFIFPNPFKTDFVVALQTACKGKIVIEVYSIDGRKISSTSYQNTLTYYPNFVVSNLEYLKAGMYILQVQTPKEKFIQSLIKD